MNELGKTFMPYTQSNYRMHPMVSSWFKKMLLSGKRVQDSERYQ